MQDTEQRLMDLEVKASFNEDLLDHLNQIVASQQVQIDALAREIKQLRQQGLSEEGGPPRTLREEAPPHY